MRWLAFGAVAALALGCGAGNNQTSLERELQDLIRSNVLPAEITEGVECPEQQEVSPGASFLCDLTVEGQLFELEVAYLDAQGRYEVTRRHAVLKVLDVQTELAAQAGPELGFSVQANCGNDDYLVAQVGGKFRCKLERVSYANQAEDVDVLVTDAQGGICWHGRTCPDTVDRTN